MKVIFIAMLSLLSLTDVTCQSDDTCQSLRRLTEEQCEQPLTSQGRPGKIGPHGPPGPKGSIGAPGGSARNPSEVEELKEQIRLLNESFQEVYRAVKQNHRVELCGIGIKDGRVRDEDLTESSSFNAGYRARYGRLDNTGEPRGFWHAAVGRYVAGEWVQVDLRSPTRVVGVVTQGRPHADQWITSFKILYGNSIDNLQGMRNNDGAEIIFQGSRDRHSHVTNRFPRPITARYFRLVVHTFHNVPSIRMEYLTCY